VGISPNLCVGKKDEKKVISSPTYRKTLRSPLGALIKSFVNFTVSFRNFMIIESGHRNFGQNRLEF
jgi:hypothetical protein